MRRRWVFAALLGGVLFSVIGGGAAVLAFTPGPEWSPLPGANPAALTFLEPSQAGRIDARSTYFSSPLRFDNSVSYAVPDTGYGAAAVVLANSRSWSPGFLDAATSLAYSWSRRWQPNFAAGLRLRWEQRQLFFDDLSAPAEYGPGLDLGGVLSIDDRTWAGAVIRDIFDTILRSDGGSTAPPLAMSLDLSVERQLTPDLRLSLAGRDVTGETTDGTSYLLSGTYARGPVDYRLTLTSGTELGWSVGVTVPVLRCRVDLAATGTGQESGITVGVSGRW